MIGGGYIKASKFDQDGGGYKLPSADGDYVTIGAGLLTKAANSPDAVSDPNKITILRDDKGKLLQRLVPDPDEPSLLQWLELTVGIGREVQADVYDVNVNLGAVERHTMYGALGVVKLE